MKIDIYKDFVNTETIVLKDEEDLKKRILNHQWGSVVLKNNYRKNENFLSAELICLDFDESLTLEEAIKVFKRHKHIIGTTKNHQKDKITKAGQVKPACDRFRVVLFLQDKITNLNDHRATVESLNKLFPQINDKYDECSEGVSKWQPCVEIVSENLEGRLIETTPYIAPPPSPTYIPASNSERGRLSFETLNFIATGEAPRGWHHARVRASMDLKAQGYTFDEALSILRKASPVLELDKDDHKTVADIYQREITNYKFRPKKEVTGGYNKT